MLGTIALNYCGLPELSYYFKHAVILNVCNLCSLYDYSESRPGGNHP